MMHKTNGFFNRILQTGTLFTRHLLMMLMMLMVAFVPMFISHNNMSEHLAETYHTDMDASISIGCERLADELRNIVLLPESIKANEYYSDLVRVQGDSLPASSAFTLAHFGNALNTQGFLTSRNEEAVIYFPKSNSVVTRLRTFLRAEDCFDSYIRFSDADTEMLMSLLQQRNSYTVLPAQEISIGGAAADCIAIFMRTTKSDVAVMSVYRSDVLVSLLGLDQMPENSCYRITNGFGNVVLENRDFESAVSDEAYEITKDIGIFGLKLELHIPNDYFDELMQPVYRRNYFLSLSIAVCGILLSIVFADLSTRKVRDLANKHYRVKIPTGKDSGIGNEVDYLAYVLNDSRSQVEDLRKKMFSDALVRAFAGMLLSEEDEKVVTRCFEEVGGNCRVALLNLPPDINFALKASILPQNLTVTYFCEMISDRTSGVLFPDSEEAMNEVATVLQFLDRAVSVSGGKVICGISESIAGPERIYMGVRTAHIAMQSGGDVVRVYSPKTDPEAEENMLWMQHERLYNSILDRNQAESVRLLQSIAKKSHTRSEAFYSILFTLRGASHEMGVDLARLDETRYDNRMPWAENVEKLERLLYLLFNEITEKAYAAENDLRQQILAYIKKNISDPNLCIAAVADYFKISERSAAAILREVSGMSFREYLLRIRMRRAEQLLCTTQNGVAEVAQECGYPAVSTFFRVFKNYFGVSPGQYRQSGGGESIVENDGNDSNSMV